MLPQPLFWSQNHDDSDGDGDDDDDDDDDDEYKMLQQKSPVADCNIAEMCQGSCPRIPPMGITDSEKLFSEQGRTPLF